MSEQITHMDSDNYCSGMRMRRGTNMKEEKFVMRFPSASDAFYSLTYNQNDILYVKLTVLFLQCINAVQVHDFVKTVWPQAYE